MTDTKASAFSLVTSINGSDYIPIVGTPGGTPSNEVITETNLITDMQSKWPLPVTQTARATVTTSWTSNTTLSGVTGLSVNLVAGHHYRITADIYTSSSVAGGLKLGLSGTVTPTAITYEVVTTYSAGISQNVFSSLGGSHAETNTNIYGHISGEIDVSVGGTLNVQAAQGGSSSTATIVQIGSTLFVDDIS